MWLESGDWWEGTWRQGVGQEGQAELAHLVDRAKEIDFLLEEQQAIGSSQM